MKITENIMAPLIAVIGTFIIIVTCWAMIMFPSLAKDYIPAIIGGLIAGGMTIGAGWLAFKASKEANKLMFYTRQKEDLNNLLPILKKILNEVDEIIPFAEEQMEIGYMIGRGALFDTKDTLQSFHIDKSFKTIQNDYIKLLERKEKICDLAFNAHGASLEKCQNLIAFIDEDLSATINTLIHIEQNDGQGTASTNKDIIKQVLTSLCMIPVGFPSNAKKLKSYAEEARTELVQNLIGKNYKVDTIVRHFSQNICGIFKDHPHR